MGKKQFSAFAFLRRASDRKLLTGLSGKQYPCGPKMMMFGGMAEGAECTRTALLRELPEELGFDEDHYAFLHAVYNQDFGETVNASARIMERIREENALRLENASSADTARQIENETWLKQSFYREALKHIANMDRGALLKAMEAQDRAAQVFAKIEGRIEGLKHFYEHLEEVSDQDKDEKGWLDVHSFYYGIDLSDDDYQTLKDLLSLKISMGLNYEISGFEEMSESDMLELVQDRPEYFLYEPQRLAIEYAVDPENDGTIPMLPYRSTQFMGRSTNPT